MPGTIPPFEEDLRHADRNEEARERASDKLRPVMSKLLASILEIKEEELPAARDAIKELMKTRKIREERKNQTMAEVIKYGVVAILGAVATWVASHWGTGK